MGLNYESIAGMMVQNGSNYELLEEETRDYVFYPAIQLLADTLPDEDELIWACLAVDESTDTRQSIRYIVITASIVASGCGYFETDGAGGRRENELTVSRVSDITELEVKSIDGREIRGEYTVAGRPFLKLSDHDPIDVTLGSRRPGRSAIAELIANLMKVLGASR